MLVHDPNKNENPIKFTFVDVHGNLKAVSKRPYKGRSIHNFNSFIDFEGLIYKIENGTEERCSFTEDEVNEVEE